MDTAVTEPTADKQKAKERKSKAAKLARLKRRSDANSPKPSRLGSGSDELASLRSSRGSVVEEHLQGADALPIALPSDDEGDDQASDRDSQVPAEDGKPQSSPFNDEGSRVAKAQMELLSKVAGDVSAMHSDYRKVANSISAIHANYNSLKDWLSTQDQLARCILQHQERLHATIGQRSDVPKVVDGDKEGAGVVGFLDPKPLQVPAALEPSKDVPGYTIDIIEPPADAYHDSANERPKKSMLELGRINSEMPSVKSVQVGRAAESPSNGDPKSNLLEPEKFQVKRTVTDQRQPSRVVVAKKLQIDVTHDSHNCQEPGNVFQGIVSHHSFEYFSACIIFTHSIFIGVYVEYLAAHDSEGHVLFSVINILLTLCFLAEVVLCALAYKKEFFFGEERTWNLFDCTLMCLVCVEWGVGIMLAGKNKKKMKTVLKIAEMARTARILRIFRCLRFSETLQIIIVKIFMSIQTLAWVLLLIFMMQGVVAVCFTQGANDYLAGRQFQEEAILSELDEHIIKHFGSVGKSVNTCFASISGGITWQNVSDELSHLNVLYAIIFGIYIALTVFIMLNMITGIFINDMMRADNALLEEAQAKKVQVCAERLHKLFTDFHQELGGEDRVNMDEFVLLARDPAMADILEEIGMHSDEAEMLFLLLDEDCSGDLTVDEFLNGCISLRGGCTGLDAKVILYENRVLRQKINSFLHNIEDLLIQVCNKTPDLSARTASAIAEIRQSKESKSSLDVDGPETVQCHLSSLRPPAVKTGSKKRQDKKIAGAFGPIG